MGDPKKLRRKYSTPNHPWNKSVIEAERILVKEYGLAKKQEIYLANSFIKKYRSIAKSLIVNQSAQGLKERDQMMNKLRRLGLLSAESNLDDVLSLEPRDLLERRLQTLVFKNGLGRSVKQARQFITHRHVLIGDKIILKGLILIKILKKKLNQLRNLLNQTLMRKNPLMLLKLQLKNLRKKFLLLNQTRIIKIQFLKRSLKRRNHNQMKRKGKNE